MSADSQSLSPLSGLQNSELLILLNKAECLSREIPKEIREDLALELRRMTLSGSGFGGLTQGIWDVEKAGILLQRLVQSETKRQLKSASVASPNDNLFSQLERLGEAADQWNTVSNAEEAMRTMADKAIGCASAIRVYSNKIRHLANDRDSSVATLFRQIDNFFVFLEWAYTASPFGPRLRSIFGENRFVARRPWLAAKSAAPFRGRHGGTVCERPVDLAKLRQAMIDFRATIVRGISGSGKSYLLQKAIDEYLADHPSARAFLAVFDSSLDAHALLREVDSFARSLAPNEGDIADEANYLARIARVDRQILIVLDGFEQQLESESGGHPRIRDPRLAEFVAAILRLSNAKIVIGSQVSAYAALRDVGIEDSDQTTLDVGTVQTTDAEEYFRRRGLTFSSLPAVECVKRLGNHVLAIVCAADLALDSYAGDVSKVCEHFDLRSLASDPKLSAVNRLVEGCIAGLPIDHRRVIAQLAVSPSALPLEIAVSSSTSRQSAPLAPVLLDLAHRSPLVLTERHEGIRFVSVHPVARAAVLATINKASVHRLQERVIKRIRASADYEWGRHKGWVRRGLALASVAWLESRDEARLRAALEERDLARRLFDEGAYDPVLQLTERAAASFAELTEERISSDARWILRRNGMVREKLGRPALAVQRFEVARRAAASAGQSNEQDLLSCYIFDTLIVMGAVGRAGDALAEINRKDGSEFVGRFGVLLQRQGRNLEAVAALTQAVGIERARSASDKGNLCWWHWVRARAYLELHLNEECQQDLSEARAIAADPTCVIGDYLAHTILLEASLAERTGNRSRALALGYGALQLSQSIGYRRTEGEALALLSELHRAAGEYEASHRLRERGIEISKRCEFEDILRLFFEESRSETH